MCHETGTKFEYSSLIALVRLEPSEPVAGDVIRNIGPLYFNMLFLFICLFISVCFSALNKNWLDHT